MAPPTWGDILVVCTMLASVVSIYGRFRVLEQRVDDLWKWMWEIRNGISREGVKR